MESILETIEEEIYRDQNQSMNLLSNEIFPIFAREMK